METKKEIRELFKEKKTELNQITVTLADLNTSILKNKNGANGMTMTDTILRSILRINRGNTK